MWVIEKTNCAIGGGEVFAGGKIVNPAECTVGQSIVAGGAGGEAGSFPGNNEIGGGAGAPPAGQLRIAGIADGVEVFVELPGRRFDGKKFQLRQRALPAGEQGKGNDE